MISLICKSQKTLQKPKTENRFMAARGSWCKGFVVFQSLARVQSGDPMDCSMPASLSFTISWNLLKVISIESVVYMYGIHVCYLTIFSSVVPFSSCLQPFPASGSFLMSQFFISGGQLLAFSFSISPSNEYSGLISFRMDWLDLLAVQGTLESSPTPVYKHQFFGA